MIKNKKLKIKVKYINWDVKNLKLNNILLIIFSIAVLIIRNKESSWYLASVISLIFMILASTFYLLFMVEK